MILRCGLGGVEHQFTDLSASGDEGGIYLGFVALLAQVLHGFGQLAFDEFLGETPSGGTAWTCVIGDC